MSWTIWSSNSHFPVAKDLTEHQARVVLREPHPNLDLYAENSIGDLIERYDGKVRNEYKRQT